MFRFLLAILMTVGCVSGVAAGLTVESSLISAEGASNSGPFHMALDLRNDTAEEVRVFAWQTLLYFEPLDPSMGEVRITGTREPDDYLMADRSPFGPTSQDRGNARYLVSDADLMQFTGAPIGAGESAHVADLEVTADPGLRGEFRLMMAMLDTAMPDDSSYWLPQPDAILEGFANTPTAANPMIAELGRFTIVPEPSGFGCWMIASLSSVGRRRRLAGRRRS